MMLFKYSKITDYFKTNLRERQIWFSAPSDFNDIDDSALRIDWRLTDEDILNERDFVEEMIYKSAVESGDYSDRALHLVNEAYLEYQFILADRGPDGTPDQHGTLRASMIDALEIRRKTIGICCFSQDNMNRLLWSHYADGDRGICISIETKFDGQCFPQIEEVNYVDVLPKIKLLSHMGSNLITLYTTKSKEWAYEREIRAFQHVRGNYPMDPRCLVNVFFGERTAADDIKEIVDIVRANYGKQVTLLRMVRGIEGERVFQTVPD